MILLIPFYRFGSSGVADESISLAERWSQSKDGEEFLSTDLDKLSSSLVQEFLNQLLNKVCMCCVCV